MKKAIGLTADVSTFNTTLPQTRHLNYFMNTNPRGFAKGGDVKAGIPNYPNPNVTSGFLPMALGFAPGGEVEKKDSVTKIYDFFFGYFKNVLGLNDDEAKEKTEEIIDNKTDEEIQDIVQNIPSGPSQEVFDREEEIIGLETPRKPVTPTDTVTATPEPITTRSDRQGAFDNVPMQPLPKISTEQQQREYEDSQKSMGPIPQITSPNNGGITQIPQEKFDEEEEIKGLETPRKEKNYKWADLNKDGVIDEKDLEIARNTPGLGWLIKIIEGIIGGFDDSEKEETPIEPKGPDVDKETEIKESEEQEDNKKIKPELKIKPPQDNITEDDQNTLKKGAEFLGKSNQEQMEIANKGGITALDPSKPDKTKKDVPSWALPMMSAGFAMMASKSPYFMQALGEAGQAGVETYSGMKETERQKALDEAQIEGLQARAAYDRGEGRMTSKPTIINDSKGRRVYAIFDREKNQYVPIESASGGPQYAVRSIAEIDEYLSGIHLNWSTLSEVEKQALRDAQIALDMGIAKTNVSSTVDEKDDEPGIIGKIITGVKEGITKKKNGGIVSLRR